MHLNSLITLSYLREINLSVSNILKMIAILNILAQYEGACLVSREHLSISRREVLCKYFTTDKFQQSSIALIWARFGYCCYLPLCRCIQIPIRYENGSRTQHRLTIDEKPHRDWVVVMKIATWQWVVGVSGRKIPIMKYSAWMTGSLWFVIGPIRQFELRKLSFFRVIRINLQKITWFGWLQVILCDFVQVILSI